MIAAALLAAAVVVTSARPQHVSLTVYRAPNRGRDERMDLRWLGGFALVTETRTLAVPAGEATLRFEGVADGIIPVSAIVEGLPGGTVEKDQDARVLSPAALVDGTLGRQVTLRRTDPRSGRVIEQDATVVAGPAGGVVVRTPEGVEALGCAGLGESERYPAVPDGLSPTPVLSVTTRSPRAATVTVRLSYLATGFDWSASYVATLRPDGTSFGLFAWLTLANANAQGFPGAEVQAVAGRLERRYVEPIARAEAGLTLSCYPLGTTTSDLKRKEIIITGVRMRRAGLVAEALQAVPAPPAPPPPPPPAPPPAEDLGDLKLYRVPMPVNINPNGQKQVALLVQPAVRFTQTYRAELYPWSPISNRPVAIVLKLANDKAQGLGVPLPAGSTALYAQAGGARLLLGEGTLGDTAVAEKTMLAAGTSPRVRVSQRITADKLHEATATNANPFPVALEVKLDWYGSKLTDASAPLPLVDGAPTWRVTVPANGRAVLTYRTP